MNGKSWGPDPRPLKNHKNIGFLSNTAPDSLKITKLSSQQSKLGHHRPFISYDLILQFTGILRVPYDQAESYLDQKKLLYKFLSGQK